VESLVSGETPSTKAALAALAGVVSDRANFLVVLERSDAVTWLSLRNAHEVHIVAVDQVNTYDVLATDDIVFTRGAYDAFVSGAPRATTVASTDEGLINIEDTRGRQVVAATEEAEKAEKPAKAEAKAKVEATPEAKPEAGDAKPELPKGAKAPLKSGGAPKGFEVKGNADSGLYHEPDGQWYDATVAEFYFKTAEDAEAAGFTRAGDKEDDK
jgi:large subunit ribosomal protein L4